MAKLSSPLILIFCFLLFIGFINAFNISIRKDKRLKAKDVLPAALMTIQQNSLNYMSQQLTPLIKQQLLNNFQIPDIDSDIDTPIGQVLFQLSNIHINNFEITVPTVQVASQGLNVLIQNSQASLTADWHYKKKHWPHLADHGSADASIGLQISFLLQISTSNPSGISISVTNFNAIFTQFNLKLHGGESWLYDLIIKNFRKDIEKSVQSALNNNLTSVVNNLLQKQLSSLNLVVPIGPAEYNLFVDFTILSNSYNVSNSLTAGTNGRVLQKNAPIYSGMPPVMPSTLGSGKMIEFFMSDTTFNSGLYSFAQAGLLNVMITQSDIPQAYNWIFNTSSLQFIIPGIYTKYPNCIIQVKLTPKEVPTSSINSTNGIGVSVVEEAIFQVILKNGTIVDAFGLDINLILNLIATINGNTMTGNVSYKTASITVDFSTIGNLNVDILSTIVNLLFEYGLIPIANILLQKGFEIPTLEGLTLQNPQIVYGNRFLAVRSNFNYQPQQ
ncbi:hypothetical protein ABK040_000150 [Willaertia magna]